MTLALKRTDFALDIGSSRVRVYEAGKGVVLDVPIEVSQELLSRRYAGDEHKKDVHEADTAYLRRCREAVRYAAGHDPYAKWFMLGCCENGVMRTPEGIHEELVRRIQEIRSGTGT